MVLPTTPIKTTPTRNMGSLWGCWPHCPVRLPYQNLFSRVVGRAMNSREGEVVTLASWETILGLLLVLSESWYLYQMLNYQTTKPPCLDLTINLKHLSTAYFPLLFFFWGKDHHSEVDNASSAARSLAIAEASCKSIKVHVERKLLCCPSTSQHVPASFFSPFLWSSCISSW